jgi:hypothetical protein
VAVRSTREITSTKEAAVIIAILGQLNGSDGRVAMLRGCGSSGKGNAGIVV